MIVSVGEADHAKAPLERYALVVAGMHRSGTSAMARTLALLGAALPKGLMQPQADNAVGFWESERVAELNDEILYALDSDWEDVFSFRPRPYLSNFDRVFHGKAVDLLHEEFNGAALIAIKDPRFSVLTQFWERALHEAGYASNFVIMVRNPLEVAQSLRDRNNFPRDKSLLLWSSYMTAVERDTRTAPRTFVSYDELISNWRRVRDRVQERAGIPFPRDTAAAANEIDRFIDRRYRHHKMSSEDLISRVDVPDYVKKLYGIFRGACADASVDEESLDAIHGELTKIELSVGSLVADLRTRARNLEKEVTEARGGQEAADIRAEELLEELTAERARRQEESEASTRLSAEHERQITELKALILDAQTALENEQATTREAQSALSSLVGEKLSSEKYFNERLATLSDELRQKETAFIQLQRELAEQARAQLHLKTRIAELTDDLLRREVVIAETQRKLTEQARVEAELNGRISELSDKLEQGNAALVETKRALEQSISTNRSVEGRLQEQIDELATLTRMLVNSETVAKETWEELEWISEVGSLLVDGLSTRKHWWRWILPASFIVRRQRKLLEERGLFDSEEYYRANPDVAAEGADPLRHYLQYGIIEKRRRG